MDRDGEYRDQEITKVKREKGGEWTIELDHGLSFWVPADSPVVPKVGSTARCYGKGTFHVVRGLVIDGVTVYYRTEAEDDAMREQEMRDRDARRRAGWEAEREELERRAGVLPAFFRDRIEQFRAQKPDERYEWEPLEVFGSEQALLIAEAVKTPAGVERFRRQPHEKQMAAVPAISDQHSGATFGLSCSLAAMYLESLMEPAPDAR